MSGPVAPARLAGVTFRSRRIALAWVALALAGCGRDNRRAIDEARAAMGRAPRDVALAQKLLNAVIDQTSSGPDASAIEERRDALMLRGELFRSIGLYANGEADFQLVSTEVDPGYAPAYVQLAITYVERGDVQRGDPTNAIEACDMSLKTLAEGARCWAWLTRGQAHIQRGRHRREEALAAIRSSATAALGTDIERKLNLACAVPATDPRAIAFERFIERRVDLTREEVRERVVGGIAGSRADFLAAERDLRAGLRVVEDPHAMPLLIELLNDAGNLDDALLLGRVSSRSGTYREFPPIVSAMARTLESARLHAEGAAFLQRHLLRGPHALDFHLKARMLRLAAGTEDADTLQAAVKLVRKAPGARGLESARMGHLLGYFDAVEAGLRKLPPEETVKHLESLLWPSDPELSPYIPDAARRYAAASIELKKPEKALAACDVGIGFDPIDSKLLAQRAALTLLLKRDPGRAGDDVREAIVASPHAVERYYPTMREAAERLVGTAGQTLAKVEDDAVAAGTGIPTGFTRGWVFYVVARDFLAQGRNNEAMVCALETLAKDAALMNAWVVTGLARARLGERREARQAFENVRDFLPEDPAICREIIDTGEGPPDMPLRLLCARPEVEGRLVVAESLFRMGAADEALRLLAPIRDREDAPDAVRLLAARLLAPRNDPSIESLLAPIAPGTKAAAQADEIRLELATQQGDPERAYALVERLRAAKSVDLTGLDRVIDEARARGMAKMAAPAALLMAERTAAGNPAAIERLARTLRDAGETRLAIEAFDGLVGLLGTPDIAMELGVALSLAGDRAGAAEALQLVRQTWGARPLDFRRAALATLAGLPPDPEETRAAAPRAEDPLSVVVGAAIASTQPAAAAALHALRGASSWVDAAVAFSSGPPERAARALRFAIILKTPGGAPTALEELQRMREAASSRFERYLEGDALESLGRSVEALAAFEEAATAHPDLEAAWRRAFDLAVSLADDTRIDRVAASWAAARPDSARAQREAGVREALRSIAKKEGLEEAEQRLADLQRANPDDFEVAVAHLEAQRALGRKSAMVATSNEIIRLSQINPARLPRAIEILMEAFEANLPATSGEAKRVAQSLVETVPNATGPVRLLAAVAIAEERFGEAAEPMLQFLRSPARARTLKTETLREWVALVGPRDPLGSTEVARLALAARPGDRERWDVCAAALAAVGDPEQAIGLLEAHRVVDPETPCRATLARLLAAPGRDPKRALEWLPDGPSASLEDALARARALVTLNRPAEAIEHLERLPGAAESPPVLIALALAFATRGEPGDLDRASERLETAARVLGSPAGDDASNLGLLLRAMRHEPG